jgi:hypothetical protein
LKQACLVAEDQPGFQRTHADDNWHRRTDFGELLPQLLIIAGVIQALQMEQGMGLPKLMWILAGFVVHGCPSTLRLLFFFVLNVTALVLLLTRSAVATLVLACDGGVGEFIDQIEIQGGAGIGCRYLSRGARGVDWRFVLKASGILGCSCFESFCISMSCSMKLRRVCLEAHKLFFLLPNLVFQLFPIVDYKTFVRGFYSKPAYRPIGRACFIGIGVVPADLSGYLSLLVCPESGRDRQGLQTSAVLAGVQLR